MNAGFPTAEVQRAYDLCKEQASVDGAFSEDLLRFWFESAWDLCASMIGFAPPEEITERIRIDDRGGFRLSRQPTSNIQVFSGYTLVATIGPPWVMTPCDPGLCCFCDLTVRYQTGSASCAISPAFLQAVARLFSYMVANRGDAEMDPQILKKSGALAFLAATGGITYAL